MRAASAVAFHNTRRDPEHWDLPAKHHRLGTTPTRLQGERAGHLLSIAPREALAWQPLRLECDLFDRPIALARH